MKVCRYLLLEVSSLQISFEFSASELVDCIFQKTIQLVFIKWSFINDV
jgi:hypothetical protein